MKHQKVAVAVLMIGTLALGAAPASAAPTERATGSGTVAFMAGPVEELGFGELALSAHSDPKEDLPHAAKGQVSLDFDGQKVKGDVTCLEVSDPAGESQIGRAGIFGKFDEPIAGREFFQINIADRGAPGSGQPDLVEVQLRSADRIACRVDEVTSEIRRGNFTVDGEVLK